MWGQLSTTGSNLLKQPNGELLVAVNHNQLRTMVSETVDPIDWSHPPPSWAVPIERHVHSINQCDLGGTTLPMRPLRVYNPEWYKRRYFILSPTFFFATRELIMSRVIGLYDLIP